MRRLLLGIVAVLLLAPVPADAAYFHGSDWYSHEDLSHSYRVNIYAGSERNDIVVRQVLDRVLITDLTANATAGGLCTAVGLRTVSCPAGVILADLYDGDDGFSVPAGYAHAVQVKGGLGNDRITGGASGFDFLYGGEGDDAIIAGDGGHVFGDAGNDRLVLNVHPGVERYYCGAGNDEVLRNAADYQGPHEPAAACERDVVLPR